MVNHCSSLTGYNFLSLSLALGIVKRQSMVARHFESHLAEEANFTFTPALRHGDFGTSNLLYEAEHGSLTGVLDFSGTALGDPVVDFTGLQISYGEAFVQRIQRAYPLSETFLQRVRFYKGTFVLEEALFGYKNDDQEGWRPGWQNIARPGSGGVFLRLPCRRASRSGSDHPCPQTWHCLRNRHGAYPGRLPIP
jgi:hypothetical protein